MENAAQQRNIDTLYNLIEQNPRVLEEIDLIPFVETPLHVAARAGHLQFANEIMMLKPSFSWKFNPQGLRPIHLALEHGHATMVLHLIEMDNKLVRAKMRGGLTLLHLASQSGDLNLLSVVLEACPDSINDLTATNETALHFAVKYEKFKAFEFLLRWLRTNTVELEDILNQKDVEGNTTLHIAAIKNDTKAMKLLIEIMRDLHASNLMGQRAFDIINNQEIRKNLVRSEKRVRMFRTGFLLIETIHEWLIRKTGMKEKLSNEIRNMYIVVASLIATTTYQAVLSPPGGFRQVDEGGTNTTLFLAQGTSVMPDEVFMVFSATNLFAFMTSILTIVLLMPKNVGWYLLYPSTMFLAIGYIMSIMVISPNDFTKDLMVSFYDVLLPILAVVSLLFFKLT